AMASGSQKWKGNWADLVNAATATSTATVTVKPVSVAHTSWPSASEIDVVPVRSHTATTAASSTRPPTKVRRSVRRAAGYAGRPEMAMSGDDAGDVSSQHTNSSRSESVSTSPSIETVNRVMSWKKP